MRKKDTHGAPKHCWEYHNCLNETKSHCLVYKLGIETECWITNNMKPGSPGKMNGSCMNCQWFKMNSLSTDHMV